MSTATKADAIIVVSPLLKTILSVVTGQVPLLEKEKVDDNDIEDTSFERTLCAVWDLTTVPEYAHVMQEEGQLSRLLIKIITMITRTRTRELSMGILANLACHDDIRALLMNDKDILLLCRSLLWYEHQARVLLETTRLLNAFFTFATTSPSSFSSSSSCFFGGDQEENNNERFPSAIIEHDYLNLFLIPIDELSPSMYHQYTQIVMNTLHTELLYASLRLLTSITIYIHGITLSSSSSSSTTMDNHYRQSYGDQNEKMEREKLIYWAIERLNEETKGIGIGMGLNGTIAKSILYLVWTFLSYRLLDHPPSHYISYLDPSLSMITHHLHQQNDFDKSSDDQDIECLVNALHDISI